MDDAHTPSPSTLDETLKVFGQSHDPATPLTVADVAAAMNCPRGVAEDNLEALAARGDVRSKTVESGCRVWWPTPESRPSLGDESTRMSTQFETLVRTVQDYAIFMLDPDGNVTTWNRGAERIKGYAESEILGEHFSTFYTTDDREQGCPEENLAAAAEHGRTEDSGWRVRKDGSRFWANVVITAIHDDDGDLQGFSKVTRDMTERRERRMELEREREQTEQLLKTSPVAIIVEDAAGEVLRANERAQTLLGLSEREIIEDPADIDEWTVRGADGEPLSPAEMPAARVRETGDPVYDEQLSIEHPDGERRWFSVNVAPIFADDGTLDRIVTAGEDITRLKERERRLETELGEVVGRISDAFFALDTEWRFTHVNERAAQILQHSEEDLLGESIWEQFPETAEGAAWDEFREALETNEPTSFEGYYTRIDSWIETHAYPSETGVSVYFRDVTERKERELELERYGTIVETVNDGIYTVDADGRFTMINEAYEEMMDIDRDDLIGEHVSSVVDVETTEIAREFERELLEGERERARFEAEVMTPAGETFWAEATFAIIPGDETDFQRVAVVRDVTDRVEREHELEEYHAFTQIASDVIVTIDESGTIQSLNPAIEDVFGYGSDELLGEPLTTIMPPDLVDRHEASFERYLEEGSSDVDWNDVQFRGRHKDGTDVPVALSFAESERDGERFFTGVIRDDTERAEYERRLEETVAKLERSNERLEEFAYLTSHDLQEPLRMISNFLTLLEDRYRDDLDEEAREFIDYAVDGADRMREMIEDLLTYSRVETRARPLEPTDSAAVVDKAFEALRLQIEEEDVEVTVGELPTVVADDRQLTQVFQNLLSNAIKYRAEDDPRIEVGATEREDAWEFWVADNGIGIDPERTDQIFEVFKRLHTTEEYSGTGIGLALCEKIVDRHGGDIWVESDPGEGSTFRFTVPHQPPDADDADDDAIPIDDER